MTGSVSQTPALSSLEQLRALTLIVADSGELSSIARWSPSDATTNPTLLWQSAQQQEQAQLLQGLQQQLSTLTDSARNHRHSPLSALVMQFAVKIGSQILQQIPGRISTEVSAALSFNTAATQRAAHEIIDLYQRENIAAERVLIKIAATWEGIAAARLLEREGIHCNLTLVFNLMQAVACADGGITLISPFVGRISDWHQKQFQQAIDYHQPQTDPGVLSVRNIYQHLKHHHYATEIMAASFRHPQQALALAGCDAMTLSPKILQELDQLTQPVRPQITQSTPVTEMKALRSDEVHFRWAMNQDDMGNSLLADGIRRFDQDERKLKDLLSKE